MTSSMRNQRPVLLAALASLVLVDAGTSAELPALVPGVPMSSAIAGGETHSYRLTLAPGQYSRVDVTQKSIDLAVKVTGSGFESYGVDITPGVEPGPEMLSIIAADAAPLTIDVRALKLHGPNQPKGEYEIVVSETRAATPADRTLVEGQREFARAKSLIATNKVDDVRQAATHLEKALALWRSINDTKWTAIAYLDLAGAYQSLRENDAALRNFEAVMPLLHELGWQRNVGLTLQSIGYIYETFGEYQKTLDYLERAHEVLTKEPGLSRGHPTVLAGIGMTYSRLGDPQKAQDYYDKALGIYREVRNRRGEAIALHGLGQAHVAGGNYDKALPLFEQSLKIHRDTANKRREAQTLTSIGRVHSIRGENEKALAMFGDALAGTRGTGDRRLEAIVLDEMAEVRLRTGSTDEALRLFREALAIQQAIHDRRNAAVSLAGIARAEEAAGRLSEARQSIEESLALVESMRRDVEPRDLRVSFRAATNDLYETQINILMAMHEREPEGQWAAKALEASERARARGLVEALERVRPDIRSGVDPALLAREQTIRARLSDKESARIHLLTSGGSEKAAKDLDREIRELIASLYEIETAIRRSDPRYAELIAPQPLSLGAMQSEVLDDDTALVEYAVGTRRSFVWAVTRKSLTVRTLPGREELQKLASRAHELATERNRSVENESIETRSKRIGKADAQLSKTLARLHEVLVKPVHAGIGTRRLLIVPDGPLHFVPFAAIVDSSVVQRDLAILPSATALATLRRAPARKPATGVVAILADPVFRSDDARLRQVATIASATTPSGGRFPAAGLRSLPRLRFSRREADVVNELVKSGGKKVALDFAANRDLLPSLRDYRIVHFATHAVVNDRAPELSSLVLSMVDASGVPTDGHVRLHDIFNLELRGDLVVLSACETAIGPEMRGEGLMSLTHGFMYAGAPRVIATLWRIDDRATAELMRHFYTGMLKDSLPPSAALRKAQATLAKDKRWSSPYYWAAFVLQGEPR